MYITLKNQLVFLNTFTYVVLYFQEWSQNPTVRENSRHSQIESAEDYFYSNITKADFESLVKFYKEVSWLIGILSNLSWPYMNFVVISGF